MEVTKQDDAWHSDGLAIGKNGQEASRALLDERCFPVLVQHVELAGSEPASTAWIGPTGTILGAR
jgi:hypothetical protein